MKQVNGDRSTLCMERIHITSFKNLHMRENIISHHSLRERCVEEFWWNFNG